MIEVKVIDKTHTDIVVDGTLVSRIYKTAYGFAATDPRFDKPVEFRRYKTCVKNAIKNAYNMKHCIDVCDN